METEQVPPNPGKILENCGSVYLPETCNMIGAEANSLDIGDSVIAVATIDNKIVWCVYTHKGELPKEIGGYTFLNATGPKKFNRCKKYNYSKFTVICPKGCCK